MEKKHNISTAGKIILEYFLVTICLGFIFNIIQGESEGFWWQTGSFIVAQLGFIIIYLWNFKKGDYSPRALVKSRTKEDWQIYLIAAALTVVLVFLYAPMGSLIEAGLISLGFKATDGVKLIMNNFGEMLINLIFVAVFPAILEEVIFRGFIFDNLKKFRPKGQIIIASLIFMLLHASVFQTVYQFLILGLIITTVVYLTGNLKLAVLMHFVNNATAIIYTYIATRINGSAAAELNINTGFVLLAAGLFILAVGLAVGFIYLVKKMKRREIETEETKKIKIKYPKYENPMDWFWFSFGLFAAIGFWVLSLVNSLI